ncbi:Pkinase-domain-containing protein [Cylindrobasidium torrendii FP15055 ss-10]|uniref:non-specific serine/threonine protein kinase n=1 Tax=Cylindrobasidium torrendii FP15055 ss-10 TaxID=1314674 RepID=A0A0D7B142_9AGAR|nr:Pkinase-domain-containing protein [Cylindrobasidium torrendii FP15055 ss-10]
MTTMTDSADTLKALPASKLGEYTVIKDIADGTFGTVKMGVHTITGQTVAMKYISKSAINREKNKTRVRREFEYMRALRHPHIIKLQVASYEVISTPTDIIFVLEYASGELFNYIVANGRMPEPQARRFFQQLISGIEYSHRLKIVHRDLKPENVLLDDDNNVKIGDFGLSNIISDGDFLSTSCGSPNYAAPEVIKGGIYAGPEIDVWSSGVILYVMLCGRLPFEDENVQTLFSKIMHGHYSMPSFLSSQAKDLISSMLAVDPVHRITVPDITRHPFFTADLPRYLSPLPPPPGPVLGTLSSLVSPPANPVTFEFIEGFGRVEGDIIEGLVARIEGVTKEDIMESLRRNDGPQGNAVKVAYLLLSDKKLHTAKGLVEFAEAERDVQEAALDPRNALSPHALSPAGGDIKENPFEAEFNEVADSEDEDGDFDDDDDVVDEAPSSSTAAKFSVLNSSLPKDGRSNHLASYASARQGGKERRHHKAAWHFGIRSRSPPMEIMLEIYKTLKQLGMEWKEKADLGGLGGHRVQPNGLPVIERNQGLDGAGGINPKTAAQVYSIETRARTNDVVVLMNLQLYTVDTTNFIVDFHHKKTYKASTEAGAGRFDIDPSVIKRTRSSESVRFESDFRDEDVISPYVFMDVASTLIIALARG